MFWRVSPELEATRRLPAWAPFHRACGKIGLFFDQMTQDGKRGKWSCVAFTVRDRVAYELARGGGATVLDAVTGAYNGAGRRNAETDAALRLLTAVEDPFAAMLGGDLPTTTFEDILG